MSITDITTLTPVGGVFDFVDGLVDRTQGTVTGLVVLIGIIVAIVFGIKGRGIGGTIMGIAVGAFIASLPFLVPAVSGLVEETAEDAGVIIQQVDTLD